MAEQAAALHTGKDKKHGSIVVARSGATIRIDGSADHDRRQAAAISRVTWIGVAVNLLLASLKLTGGIFGRSQALIADAVHTISDLATDAAILIGVRYWCQPADEMHPHGHRKIETLVTLAIGVMLALVAVFLGYDAVSIIISDLSGAAPAPATGMALWLALGAALLSIVSKEILYRWTARWGRELKSSAVVANAWHHRSDAFSSIPPALAIGGREISLRFGSDLWFLDPLGTLIVCIMLLYAAWEVMKPALQALLDAGADGKTCTEIKRIVLESPDVLGAHRIRSRYVGANAVAVDFHLLVDGSISVSKGNIIARRVRDRLLASNLSMVDVVILVEPADEEGND